MTDDELRQRLETLNDTEVWEWPEWDNEVVAAGLRSDDRELVLLALESAAAGMDDTLAPLVLELVRSDGDAEVRAAAAISLGPVLEECDSEDYDEGELLEPVLSKSLFEEIQRALRAVYHDPSAAKLVRRRALEASVRSPRSWHSAAIRSAYLSDDGEWQVTAVFCMGFVQGFDAEILEALKQGPPEVRYEAVRAAGSAYLADAGRDIRAIALDEEADEALRLVAIEAIPNLGLHDGNEVLAQLARSKSLDIAEAAEYAIDELEMWEELEGYEPRLTGPYPAPDEP